MIEQPGIYVISRPQLDPTEISGFLRIEALNWKETPDATAAEKLIELCGRICYLSFGPLQAPRSNAEYIRNLIVSGHESVLEHATWSFVLTGVSRAFSHQLVRHRVGFAFSQLSQQYRDEADAHFVEPWQLRGSPGARALWEAHMQASKEVYGKIAKAISEDFTRQKSGLSQKEHGRALRSIARSVLPNSTETKIAITANARALRHFLAVRGSIPGDHEMRMVAAAFLGVLKIEAPSVFADFTAERLKDGSPAVIQHSFPDDRPFDKSNLRS
jgi:thymidylate synthase (FAD)